MSTLENVLFETNLTLKNKFQMNLNLKVILVDDEPDATTILSHELKTNCPNIEIVGTFNKPKDALLFLKNNEVDIIFLDIEMPVINGFEFLELAPKADYDVIFTTAYDQYALRAFKTSACEYLVKPVSSDDLIAAITKVRELRKINQKNFSLEFLMNQLKEAKTNSIKKIAIPTSDGLSMVEINDIIYCVAEDSYCNIVLRNKPSLFIAKNLKYMDELIGNEKFFRVHKSYLVNTTAIDQFQKSDGGFIIMDDKKQIPIARSRKSEFLNILSNQS